MFPIIVVLFLLYNGLGFIGIALLVLSSTLLVRSLIDHRPIKQWHVILLALGIVALFGQNAIVGRIRTSGNKFDQNIISRTAYDIYVPQKTIGGSKVDSIRATRNGDSAGYVVEYTGEPLMYLYEDSVKHMSTFGPAIPGQLFTCNLPKNGIADPGCKKIGTTKNGIDVYVDADRYTPDKESFYVASAIIGQTHVGLEARGYIKPEDLLAYFEALQKTSRSDLKFRNGNNNLLIFPYISF